MPPAFNIGKQKVIATQEIDDDFHGPDLDEDAIEIRKPAVAAAPVATPEAAVVDAPVSETPVAEIKAAESEISEPQSLDDVIGMLAKRGSNTGDADTDIEKVQAAAIEQAAQNSGQSPDLTVETPPETATVDEAAKTDATVDEAKTSDTPASEKSETPRLHTGGDGKSAEEKARIVAAAKAEAEANRGHGGGGGGGLIGGAIGAVGKLGKGALSVVKNTGGQTIADKFARNDPAAIERGLKKTRYTAHNQSIRQLKELAEERNGLIDNYTSTIQNSSAGRVIKDAAAQSNKSFNDVLSDVRAGRTTAPELVNAYKELSTDPTIHSINRQLAETTDKTIKAQEASVEALRVVSDNHGNSINAQFEANRVLEAVGMSEKKNAEIPDLETTGKDADGKPSDKLDSGKLRKKFDEAVEAMKESIMKVLRKIASALGIKM